MSICIRVDRWANVTDLIHDFARLTIQTIRSGIFSFFVIGTVFICPDAVSQPCPDLVNIWSYDSVSAMALYGHYAYAGLDRTLSIFDVSDPAALIRVKNVLLPYHHTYMAVQDIVISGNILYLLDSSENDADKFNVFFFRIFDITDPLNPLLVSTYSESGRASSITLVDQYAFITRKEQGVSILDVSNPLDPAEIVSFDTPGQATDVEICGDYAFIADWEAGLRIFDITDMFTPVEIGYWDEPERALQVMVSDHIAYVADEYFGVRILDVSELTAPIEIGNYRMDGDSCHMMRMEIKENYLITLERHASIWRDNIPGDYINYTYLNLLDRSHEYYLDFVGSLSWRGTSPTELSVMDNQILVSIDEGIITVDTTNPSEPEEISFLQTMGRAADIDVSGNYAFVADDTWSNGGLRIYDISDPVNPIEIIFYPLGLGCSSVESFGNYIFMTCANSLHVFDVSVPNYPIELNRLQTQYGIDEFVIMDNYLYLPLGYEGIRIYDISNPYHLSEVGLYQEYIPVSSMTIYNNHVFIAASLDGLKILNLEDPHNPVLVGIFEGEMSIKSVAVSGEYAYILDSSCGLPGEPDFSKVRILDISDVSNPHEIGIYDSLWVASDIAISDDYVYLKIGCWTTDTIGGIEVVDISIPTSPSTIGYVHNIDSGMGERLIINRNILFVADSLVGIEVYDISTCGSQNTPPSVDFTWFPEVPSIDDLILFYDKSLNMPLSWYWDFGDGRFSSSQFTGHYYYYSGSFDVSLTASNTFGQSSKTHQIKVSPRNEVPSISDLKEYVYLIPASAHAWGAHGSHWETEVVVHSPQSWVWPNWYFLEIGKDNSTAEGRELFVMGDNTWIQDAIGVGFNRMDTLGALLFSSDKPLVIESKTFNDRNEGTFGQHIGSMPKESALLEGDEAWLLHLSSNDQYRTNIGFANIKNLPVDILIQLYRQNGTLIDILSITIKPFGFNQIHRVFDRVTTEDIANAYAVVSSSTHGAQYFTYASVIDNISGDPIFVSPHVLHSISPSGIYYIAVASHGKGVRNENWKTDVVIVNPNSYTATAKLYLIEENQDNTNAPGHEIWVPGHHSEKITDIVDKVSQLNETTGAIRIETDFPLFITSRTYNDQDTGGTYGQFVPAIPFENVLHAGEESRLINLKETDQFRTNIGIVNVSPEPITVDIDFSCFYYIKNYHLEPFEFTRDENVFRYLSSDYDSISATVTCDSEGAEYIVYASVIDNDTGDPIFSLSSKVTAEARDKSAE